MDEENKLLDEILKTCKYEFGYNVDSSNIALRDELLKIINGYRMTIESSDRVMLFPIRIGGVIINNRNELKVFNAALKLIGGKNSVQFK